MDKINISNLFPGKVNQNNYRPLDVHSLYSITEKKQKKINFNLERLTKLREERKMKVIEQYEKVFNLCLNKINLANNLNKVELVYEVPEAVYGSFEYKPIDCLFYISEKLKKMNIETMILNECSIYITWINLCESNNT
ncbi:hypothetical protein Indivirus_1_9 [Indivirus ILV1]|uniref:Uncharacterized protein n=1 Tax=Indivirus ILV1 TaxID=1977633 RepID=A0A1V0SCF3_9VIRU|nr:hypothetical protein Indivirus_1_9 [Indivirus ILV1]